MNKFDKFIEQQHKKFGYPKCCIAEFWIEVNIGLSPGEARGGIDGYVPCYDCKIKMLNNGLKSILPKNIYTRLIKNEAKSQLRRKKVVTKILKQLYNERQKEKSNGTN